MEDNNLQQNEQKSENKDLAMLKKLYNYGLAVVFGVLCILNFVLFAVPIETDPLGLGLGCTGFSVLVGSFSDSDKVTESIPESYCAAVITVFIITVVGLAGLFYYFKAILIDQKDERAGTVNIVVAILGLIIIVMSAVIIGATNKRETSVGAAPVILIIIWSLFLLTSLFVSVRRKKFFTQYPQMKDKRNKE